MRVVTIGCRLDREHDLVNLDAPDSLGFLDRVSDPAHQRRNVILAVTTPEDKNQRPRAVRRRGL
jgi:hypothetical protein